MTYDNQPVTVDAIISEYNGRNMRMLAKLSKMFEECESVADGVKLATVINRTEERINNAVITRMRQDPAMKWNG